MITTGIGDVYTGITARSQGSSALDKDDFLNLLVTQLQNQDPLNPMENTEFTAQLAQFSSLEELQNVNSGLEMLRLSQQAIHNTQALSMVGRTVTAPGDTIALRGGEAESVHYQLDDDARDVGIHLYDASGSLAASYRVGPLAAGRHTFQWDGTDAAGACLPDGSYGVVVLAAGDTGAAVTTRTCVTGRVERVVFDGGSPQLVMNGREIEFDSIDEAGWEGVARSTTD